MASALKDVLVVDLTHVVAGPMATKTLRDLGARVVKVENPNMRNPSAPGDVTRYFEPIMQRADGSGWQSAYFAMMNGGKESIVLQLDPQLEGSREDRTVFEAMLARADVLVENFRPGVLGSLGYSWETLHERFPRLVLASLSGFGQTGPYSYRKAVDTIIQGMSGFITATGFQEVPVKVGTTVSDLLAGVYCATGVLAALHQRHRSGLGCYVDVAMLDTSFAFHGRELVSYQVRGHEPPRLGNTSPIGVYPFDVFECRDGRSFSVNCASNEAFSAFCRILGAPELAADERFRRPRDRWANREALRTAITDNTSRWDRDALLGKFLELRGSGSFPVGPVNGFADIIADPQLQHRGMLRPTRDGRLLVPGSPIKILGESGGDPVEGADVAPDPPELDADGSKIRAEFAPAAPPAARAPPRSRM
uniref:CoA transferase n=1 Tax=Alexandrium monilatum TaxID=311494 RepID=A0A7S4QHZ6_9DINO